MEIFGEEALKELTIATVILRQAVLRRQSRASVLTVGVAFAVVLTDKSLGVSTRMVAYEALLLEGSRTARPVGPEGQKLHAESVETHITNKIITRG